MLRAVIIPDEEIQRFFSYQILTQGVPSRTFSEQMMSMVLET